MYQKTPDFVCDGKMCAELAQPIYTLMVKVGVLLFFFSANCEYSHSLYSVTQSVSSARFFTSLERRHKLVADLDILIQSTISTCQLLTNHLDVFTN